jgi:hypothetical protein
MDNLSGKIRKYHLERAGWEAYPTFNDRGHEMGTERSIVPMVASDAWASCDSASFFTPSLSQLIAATATVSDRVIYC